MTCFISNTSYVLFDVFAHFPFGFCIFFLFCYPFMTLETDSRFLLRIRPIAAPHFHRGRRSDFILNGLFFRKGNAVQEGPAGFGVGGFNGVDPIFGHIAMHQLADRHHAVDHVRNLAFGGKAVQAVRHPED